MKGRIKRETAQTRIPIVGKIRCGKLNGNIPQSLDYFIADGHYSEMFKKSFGDKPKNITVIFPSDSIEEVCNERMELRQGAKLYADGDGENFRVWSEQDQDYININKSEHEDLIETLANRAKSEWYHILTLRFIIPAIKGVWGVWQFSTRGTESSIPQIVSVFDQVLERAGTVVNIPFDLSVEKVKSQKPGSKSLFPVVRLVPNISQDSLEKVRLFFESGTKIHGLITDESVKEISIKQLPKNTIENNSGDLFNG